MNNMYKNHNQSEPKLSTATPAAWKAVDALNVVSAVRSPRSLAHTCCKTPSIDVHTYIVYADL